MTELVPTAEEQRWLDVWGAKHAQADAGEMTADDVYAWVWKNKVLNAINVTIQRIKRSMRPGRDPKRQDNTWVTVAAERGAKKEDMSPLGIGALKYVTERLDERGHVYDVDWMATSSGVVVISVNIKGLSSWRRKTEPD